MIKNNEYNLIIGSHVGLSAKNKYLLGSLNEALSYGANSFMIYTGAPQNTIRTPLEKMYIPEFHKAIKNSDINLKNIIVHAPYIFNPANRTDEAKFHFAINFLVKELNRTKAIGGNLLVLHPGAHVGQGYDKGIINSADCINYALDETTDTKIAIETMAGKGTEICYTFEQLANLLKLIKPEHQNRVVVCLDTCHINDAGYDIVNDLEGVLDNFDNLIGLDRISVIHINDSKNPLNARKDRHENIGHGYIGEETILKVIYNPRLNNIPKILETPYIDGKPPYRDEINLIKNKGNN